MRKLLISEHETARTALRNLNGSDIVAPVLFIQNDNNEIIGSLTDGDIRRGLLQELNIDDNVKVFMHKNFRFLTENNYLKSDLLNLKKQNIRFTPVLKSDNTLLKILDINNLKSNLPLTAVIMAGGKGERLLPLTKNTPKPMLKIGSKPIIEHNIDRLLKFGINHIIISVRYLSQQIIDYLGDGSSKNCVIEYIFEDAPLGTVGSLKIPKNINTENVILMNSDLLTDIDFDHFYEIFNSENADMAVATIPYNVNVPYAVLEFENGKNIKGFIEKPNYTYYSNAGIYILKKSIIDLIPENTKFDATDLMNKVIETNKKLIAEPVHSYWLDIGRIQDYFKAQEDIKFIVL